jgi:hypothetical protein
VRVCTPWSAGAGAAAEGVPGVPAPELELRGQWALAWDASALVDHADGARFGMTARSFRSPPLAPTAVARSSEERSALSAASDRASFGAGASVESALRATGFLSALEGGVTARGARVTPRLDVERVRLHPSEAGACDGFEWRVRLRGIPLGWPLPTLDARNLTAA